MESFKESTYWQIWADCCTLHKAKERDEKKKEPVEVVEVGEAIGVTAKSKSTPASQFAREYSSQMQQSGFNVNPEFE